VQEDWQMDQEQECVLPGKLNVVSAEWLCSGYVFALKKTGGFLITDIRPGSPFDRAQNIVVTIDKMSREPHCSAIFLTKEDCALVSEFFPDVLKRQN
jgi:hypothetical protein